MEQVVIDDEEKGLKKDYLPLESSSPSISEEPPLARLDAVDIKLSVTLPNKKGEKEILKGITLCCKTGEMVAIMGPSGAGKTSFITILGKRTLPTSGQVLLSGEDIRPMTFRRCTGFVTQQSVLYPSLTTWELMEFYACLRLPHISVSERRERIEKILRELNLYHVRDTLIGSDLAEGGGLSGGERRRVSVAVELLSDPDILLLDEPTSGLDSSTALSLCDTLSRLTKTESKSVIATIHQPRQQIFSLFDTILLIAKGRVAYYGKVSLCTEWFALQGLPIPPLTSAADHIIDCVTIGPKRSEDEVDRLLDAWENYESKDDFLQSIDPLKVVEKKKKQSAAFLGGLKNARASLTNMMASRKSVTDQDGSGRRDTKDQIPPLSIVSPLSSDEEEKRELEEKRERDMSEHVRKMINHHNTTRASWPAQLAILLWKDFKILFRDPLQLQVRFYQALVTSLLIGIVFLQLGSSQDDVRSRAGVLGFVCISIGFTTITDGLLTFQVSRTYYSRDLAVSLYDASSFFISQLLVNLPAVFIIGTFELTVIYWMTGLRTQAAAFFYYILFYGTLFLVSLVLGFLVSVISPNVVVATALAPIMMVFWTMFAGVFLAADSVPNWLIWCWWMSPLRCAYVDAFLTQFQDTTWPCPIDTDTDSLGVVNGTCSGFCLSTGVEVIDYYGFSDQNLWVNFGILVAEFFGCAILAFAFLVLRERNTYPA